MDVESQSTSLLKEKTSIRELEDYLDSLKAEIKTWEYEFISSNLGQTPTAKDIRSNKRIASKYKKYQKYKDQLTVIKERKNKHKIERQSRSAATNHHKKKSKRGTNFNDQLNDEEMRLIEAYRAGVDDTGLGQEEDLEVEEPEPEVIADEIGPTPQLNGRVLSIFDINVKLTPEKQIQSTPSKGRALTENMGINKEFLTVESPTLEKGITQVESTQRQLETPSKSRITNDDDKFKTPTGKKVQRKLLFSPSSSKATTITTPRKNMFDLQERRALLQETPKYLRSDSQSGNLEMLFELSPDKSDSPANDKVSQSITTTPTKSTPVKLDNTLFETPSVTTRTTSPSKYTEPSPFMTMRGRGKSLFQLSQDLKEIIKQRDQWIDYEDEDIKKLIEDENRVFAAASADAGADGEGDGDEQQKQQQEGAEVDDNESQVINERHRKKAKTNKRSTRRSKVTSNPNVENVDDYYKLGEIQHKISEIQEVGQSKRKRNGGGDDDDDDNDDDRLDEEDELDLIDVIHSGDEYDDHIGGDTSSEEEDYELEAERERRRQKQLEQGVSNTVSNNFVRLKINHKNKGKNFRRRR